ncbi:MAG: hypothetical protein ACRYFR_00880 [Janthinobacterium lividum]
MIARESGIFQAALFQGQQLKAHVVVDVGKKEGFWIGCTAYSFLEAV